MVILFIGFDQEKILLFGTLDFNVHLELSLHHSLWLQAFTKSELYFVCINNALMRLMVWIGCMGIYIGVHWFVMSLKIWNGTDPHSFKAMNPFKDALIIDEFLLYTLNIVFALKQQKGFQMFDITN